MEKLLQKYNERLAEHKKKEEYYKSEEFKNKYVESVLPAVLTRIAEILDSKSLVNESHKIFTTSDKTSDNTMSITMTDYANIDISHRPEEEYLYCFDAYDRAMAVHKQVKQFGTDHVSNNGTAGVIMMRIKNM